LWTGGVYGLVYIAIAIWLIPRLGSAPVLAFDHVGLFGIVGRPLDWAKV